MFITGETRATSGVQVGTYGTVGTPENDSNATLGWVQPAGKNPAWILYFTKKGEGLLYSERDENGGVIGEPIRLSAKKE